MKNLRLALWIFGPIGSGKSHVLSQLSLEDFERVDQDAELERLLRAAGLPLDTREYNEGQTAEFLRLRGLAATAVWGRVPAWRAEGANLFFETTGNKPPLFRTAVEAGRADGYKSLGCALRLPLAACLKRNRERERVLSDSLVEETWRDFENALTSRAYAEIFAQDQLHICASAEEAVAVAQGWIQQNFRDTSGRILSPD